MSGESEALIGLYPTLDLCLVIVKLPMVCTGLGLSGGRALLSGLYRTLDLSVW